MPERYRLDMSSMAVIMDQYAKYVHLSFHFPSSHLVNPLIIFPPSRPSLCPPTPASNPVILRLRRRSPLYLISVFPTSLTSYLFTFAHVYFVSTLANSCLRLVSAPSQLAEQYGPDVANKVLERSRSNLNLASAGGR